MLQNLGEELENNLEKWLIPANMYIKYNLGRRGLKLFTRKHKMKLCMARFWLII